MARLSVPIGRQRHSPTDGGSETMEFEYSERTKELKARVEDFMNRYIYPNEELYYEQLEEGGNRWKVVPIIEEVKQKAKADGLWNFFLPESMNGAGLTNMEYAPLRSEEHTSELQPLMRTSYAGFCLKKKKT